MTQEILNTAINLNQTIVGLERVCKDINNKERYICLPDDEYVQKAFLKLAEALKEDCQKDLEAL